MNIDGAIAVIYAELGFAGLSVVRDFGTDGCLS